MFVLWVYLVWVFTVDDHRYTGNVLNRVVLRRIGLARAVQVVQSTVRTTEMELWVWRRDVVKDGTEDIEIGEEVDENEEQKCDGDPLRQRRLRFGLEATLDYRVGTHL